MERRLDLRTDTTLGTVMVEGDGVNVAARLDRMAEPRGICVSAKVMEETPGDRALDFDLQHLENIAQPVRVFRIAATVVALRPSRTGRAAIVNGRGEQIVAARHKKTGGSITHRIYFR